MHTTVLFHYAFSESLKEAGDRSMDRCPTDLLNQLYTILLSKITEQDVSLILASLRILTFTPFMSCTGGPTC